MRTIKIITLILFLLITILNAQTQDMRIAILDLESGRGIEPALSRDTTDLIRTEMINLNMFTVLERAQMKEILKEQEFQLSGCTETSCAVKVGKLLSANKILIGKVSKFGKTYSINIRIVEVEKGIGEYAESVIAKSEDDIPVKIKELVKMLAGRITGTYYEGEPLKKEVKTNYKDKVAGKKVKTIGGMEFVRIDAGEFLMGSDDGDSDEKPVHKVNVSGFYMSKYEVTQKQYNDIMGKNPSSFKGDNLPVDSVSWNATKEFCEKFSKKYGVKARLPYKAEWEYACRAGSKTKYYWGDSIDGNYCWFRDNSNKETHPVGQKRPNSWGLYDMSGNVWEWCMDWYDENYYSSSISRDPKGPSSGKNKVLRGGAWNSDDWDVRAARRVRFDPDDRFGSVGFRVAVSLQ